MVTLYHYTCDDGLREILADDSMLRPGPLGLLWLTDLARPARKALGLTSYSLSCDRTSHRFKLTDSALAHPWVEVRRVLPAKYVHGLEAAPGAAPKHWWISAVPLQSTLDEVRRG